MNLLLCLNTCNILSHDGSEWEQEADKGWLRLGNFTRYVDKLYGKNYLVKLFGSKRTEKEKINIINYCCPVKPGFRDFSFRNPSKTGT